MNKHYVTIENGFIVDGFSDAFRQPEGTDTLISENVGRQFIFNNITNPQLKDDDGFAKFKADGSEATKEEQPQYSEFVSKQEVAVLHQEVAQLEAIDRGTIRLLITLIETLLEKNVIAGADFTAEEIALYNKALSLKGQIW